MRILLACLVVVAAACSGKSDAPSAGSAGSAGSAAVAAKPDAQAAPAVPLGPDGLPVVCGEWKAAIDKLQTCDALPKNARDSLVSVYQQASAGWGQLPADAKKNLTTVCRAGADSVLKGAAATCKW